MMEGWMEGWIFAPSGYWCIPAALMQVLRPGNTTIDKRFAADATMAQVSETECACKLSNIMDPLDDVDEVWKREQTLPDP
ncbi:hypothetical protein CCMA1212_008820 [Trichoderma ghanense]|uniref:Uncharacterized protein n=1 Tax=Trichoderma ghanense TaxID=65468 RepID=A0ABY2GUQ6_9HYPO